MKILITESQLKKIYESDINFHISRPNHSIELDKIEPYGSDTIIMMRGRGTGHFGSGLYFSTYSCKDWEYDEKLAQLKNEKSLSGKVLHQVLPNIYSVDMDIYKNLYRVKDENHGDSLFNTLKKLNEIFYNNIKHNGELDLQNDLSTDYIKVKHNLEVLGMQLPKYRDFINMIKDAGKNIVDKKNSASFSTRIMEYNGYNGVNVSNVPVFDTRRHGSVIYDISKIYDKLNKIVDFPSYCRYNVTKDYIDTGDSFDIKNDILSGDIGSIAYNAGKGKINKDVQRMIIKRYNKFIEPAYLELFDPEIVKLYYGLLLQKIKKGLIDDEPSISIVRDLIYKDRFDIILDKNYTYEYIDFNGVYVESTMLEFVLNNIYEFSDSTAKKILNNINRDMTPREKNRYDQIIEDFT